MKQAPDWKEYSVIATGDGMKLERWGSITLLRPDPQVIWHARAPLANYPRLNARYIAEQRIGEKWEILRKVPESFLVHWRNLTFSLKLMKGFKHVGLFPEQAVNWDEMMRLISTAGRSIRVLNLFAYTGGATLACLAAGAHVTHVDAATAMVARAKENAQLSGLADRPCRYIIDDCVKFVQREIKRGKRYDAIIMDPPSFGRGPNGELWKIEQQLDDLLTLTEQVLSDNPLFFLINSYTTGLQPTVIKNLLTLHLGALGGKTTAYEVTLPTEEGIDLPCGCSGLTIF
ncbi:MAG: class I SAM-dependent methyltransferase [Clostridia bacterium]|nr:class I SAM-dependent methyltransferase [Clostridia bacterium]